KPACVVMDTSALDDVGAAIVSVYGAESSPLVALVGDVPAATESVDCVVTPAELPESLTSFVRFATGQPTRARLRLPWTGNAVAKLPDGRMASLAVQDLSEEAVRVFANGMAIAPEQEIQLRIMLPGGEIVAGAKLARRQTANGEGESLVFRFAKLDATS